MPSLPIGLINHALDLATNSGGDDHAVIAAVFVNELGYGMHGIPLYVDNQELAPQRNSTGPWQLSLTRIYPLIDTSIHPSIHPLSPTYEQFWGCNPGTFNHKLHWLALTQKSKPDELAECLWFEVVVPEIRFIKWIVEGQAGRGAKRAAAYTKRKAVRAAVERDFYTREQPGHEYRLGHTFLLSNYPNMSHSKPNIVISSNISICPTSHNYQLDPTSLFNHLLWWRTATVDATHIKS